MATHTIGRLLIRVGGFLVLWGPLLTLGLLGGTYLFDCLNSLTDPGTGLVYYMEGRKGPITLRAKSYTVAIFTGTLIAREVSVTSPSDDLVASAGEVDLRLPDYFGGSPRSLTARVKGLRGKVVRDSEGRFALLDLLPPERKEPSTMPFRIDVEDAVLQVIDETSSNAWSRTLRIPWTLVDGVGDKWRASGEIHEVNGGQAKLALMSIPGKEIALDGEFTDFDISPWLGPLQRSREVQKWDLLKDIAAERLVVRGPVALRLPHEGPAQIDGSVVAVGSSVRYRDLFAQKGRLEASFNNTEMKGRIDLEKPGAQLNFSGTVGWKDGVALDGFADASVWDKKQIPARFQGEIPKELNFSGAVYSGLVRYSSRQGIILHGASRAAAASWKDYKLENPSLGVSLSKESLALRSVEASFRGIPVKGGGNLNLKSKALHAVATSGPIPLEKFQDELGRRLRGVTTLEVKAEGTFEKPNVELRAQGFASAKIEGDRFSDLGPFNALARLDGDVVRIDRLALLGPIGVANASGTYNLQTRRIDLTAAASGIDLGRLHSKLNGSAAGLFHLQGTPGKFEATGPVEVYGLVIQDQPIPLLAAELRLTPQELIAEEVRASRGAARLRGSATWNFENDALSGAFTAESIQLHDFLSEGNEGSIDVVDGALSGTLTQPLLTGMVRGQDLVLQEVRIDSAQGRLRLNGKEVEVRDAALKAGTGQLQLDASYNLETRDGLVKGKAEQVPIDRIQPLLPPETGIEGTVRGDFSAQITNARLGTFEGDGGVEGLSVNRAFLGNGFYTLRAEGRSWSGTLEVGQPERFIQVPEFKYLQDTDSIEADVVAYGLPVRDLYFAGRPYFTPEPGQAEPRVNLPRNLRDMLDRLQGALDLSLHVSGSINDPDLRIESLLVRNTTVDGESTGQISAEATRVDRLWTISKLEWSGGPGILDIKGTVKEDGPIALDGNLNNFDVQWMQRFVPVLGSVNGTGNLFFTVTGQSREPQIEASLEGSFFQDKLLAERIKTLPPAERQAAEEEARAKELKMEIYPILVSDGAISLDGRFFYRGFTGTLTGSVPFRYPFNFPTDEELDLSLHVPERQLDDLKSLVPSLDVKRTDGKVWADVKLNGTIDSAGVSGGINLEASTLAFMDVDTTFKDVKGTTGLNGQTVALELAGKPDKGGSMTAQARIRLPEITETFDRAAESLLSSAVEGSVTFTDAHVAEKQLPIDETGKNTISTEFTANGAIKITGPLRKPLISTDTPLALEKVKGDIPAVVLVGGGAAESYVEPTFNLAYVMGTRDVPAELRAAASVLNLWGRGTVTGSLSDLEANADFRVRAGHIRLPNARIAIQEGGTVRLRYDGGGFDPVLRLDVDIEGRTALSTIRFGTLIERYDIYLELRGNLLNSEEQTITARSDPPDLSQERIMNLLGQVELVEKISGNLIGGQQRRQLEQALTGLALPYVFDPFTEELARQLGLEYLSLDYGPLGQTTITAAKWLGKGFSIQGSREVSTPIDRVPDYELRLTYRPPRRIRQLRGLVFSLGLDQERPWKLSVEYGGRLPNTGSPNKDSRIFIGPEPKNPPPPPPPK